MNNSEPLLSKSFYLLSKVLNAGGGYSETKYLLSTLTNVDFVSKSLLSYGYDSLSYGLSIYLKVVEKGEVVQEIDICSLATLKLEGYQAEFHYSEDSWVFESEIDEEQKEELEEYLIETESNITKGLSVEIDWEKGNPIQIKHNILKQGEFVPLEQLEEIDNYFTSEATLGVYEGGLSEEELIKVALTDLGEEFTLNN